MSSSPNGSHPWMKYGMITAILLICLIVTLTQTGFFSQRIHLSTGIVQELASQEKPSEQKQVEHLVPQAFDKDTEHTVYQEKPVEIPVIPVEPGDRNQKLPSYEGVPDEVYSTNWWLSAAYLQWDFEKRPTDYRCKMNVKVGNWWICMDKKFAIRKPCLVYSFGIANDFSFDDAMAALGCEVHSFDPSMKTDDYIRNTSVHFHAIGISSYTDDKFIPRRDMYVKDNTTWAIMTLNLIKTALGHKHRSIDVLKIDVEGHEWDVIENLLQDNMFPSIRQFMLEYHLFPDWPSKSEYPKLLRTYKKLHDLGFKKFITSKHPLTHIPDKFNIQADVAYVNTKFVRKERWKVSKKNRLKSTRIENVSYANV